jgi:hypothetical protein
MDLRRIRVTAAECADVIRNEFEQTNEEFSYIFGIDPPIEAKKEFSHR